MPPRPYKGPYTIRLGVNGNNTQIEQQRKNFRNPRGKKNYYSFGRVPASWAGLDTSPNGKDWTNIDTLWATAERQSCWIYEQGANSRLLLYYVVQLTDRTTIRVSATAINDGDTETTDLWTTTFTRADDGVDNPVVCLAPNGYLWVAWSEEYTSKGNQRFDIRCVVTTTTYPVTAPTWTARTVVFNGVTLTNGIGPNKVELIPLTATGDVAFIYSFYSSVALDYRIWGRTGSYAGGVAPTFGSEVGFAAPSSDTLHSSVAESGPNSDVFVLFESTTPALFVQKWDISTGGVAGYVIVYNGNVDSLGLSIMKKSEPDLLRAFYVKNGVAGDFFEKHSTVDGASWSTELTIDDDTESLDRLSVTYEDWPRDDAAQLSYTRQTTYYTRWVEYPAVRPIPLIVKMDKGPHPRSRMMFRSSLKQRFY